MYKGYIYRHWLGDKSYIGQTYVETPQQRWGKDGKGYYNQTKFGRAIKKYGWHNFGHEVLLTFECETKEELVFWLNQWEAYCIEKYDSFNNGYNSTTGGDSYVVCDETKQKMSESANVAVVCLNTRKKFDSMIDAWEWLRSGGNDIPIGSIGCISLCCTGDKSRALKHPLTGEKLAWAYYKDYINMTQEEIGQKLTIATRDVFYSAIHMDLSYVEDKNTYKNTNELDKETLGALDQELSFLSPIQLHIFKEIILQDKPLEVVGKQIGRSKESVGRTCKEVIKKIQQRFTVEQFKEILY
jgi:hypothetical protein